jgi:hypothetical protein
MTEEKNELFGLAKRCNIVYYYSRNIGIVLAFVLGVAFYYIDDSRIRTTVDTVGGSFLFLLSAIHIVISLARSVFLLIDYGPGRLVKNIGHLISTIFHITAAFVCLCYIISTWAHEHSKLSYVMLMIIFVAYSITLMNTIFSDLFLNNRFILHRTFIVVLPLVSELIISMNMNSRDEKIGIQSFLCLFVLTASSFYSCTNTKISSETETHRLPYFNIIASSPMIVYTTASWYRFITAPSNDKTG